MLLGLPNFRKRLKKKPEDPRKKVKATFECCSKYWVSFSFDSAIFSKTFKDYHFDLLTDVFTATPQGSLKSGHKK